MSQHINMPPGLDTVDPDQFMQDEGDFIRSMRDKDLADREAKAQKQFCHDCQMIMRSEAGKRMMAHLQKLVHFGSSAFRPDDDYNTHAAACRDGAASTIRLILWASENEPAT